MMKCMIKMNILSEERITRIELAAKYAFCPTSFEAKSTQVPVSIVFARVDLFHITGEKFQLLPLQPGPQTEYMQNRSNTS